MPFTIASTRSESTSIGAFIVRDPRRLPAVNDDGCISLASRFEELALELRLKLQLWDDREWSCIHLEGKSLRAVESVNFFGLEFVRQLL